MDTKTIATELLAHPEGYSIDILTGEKFERDGAFYMVATKNLVTYYRHESEYAEEMISSALERIVNVDEFDAVGIWPNMNTGIEFVDMVQAIPATENVASVIELAKSLGELAIGIMIDGNYSGTITL